jgi:hypothetical protein
MMKPVPGILAVLALGASASFVHALSSRSQDSAALAKAVAGSKHSLAEGIRQVSSGPETAISAKFEFDDDNKLSLSVYTAEKGLGVEAEHNVLKEYAGSPDDAAWKPGTEVFNDVEHVARAAQQLTLMALAKASLADVVAKAEKEMKGQVLSVTPVLEGRSAAFTVQFASGDKVTVTRYMLLDDEEGEEHEGHEGHEEREGH